MLASMLMIVMVVAKGVSSIPVDRNFKVECEKEISAKGVNYFTIVVFSMKIAVPCPPGTVYWHSICDCDQPHTDAVTTPAVTVSPTTERTSTPSQVTEKTTRKPSVQTTHKPLVQTTTVPVVPTTQAPTLTTKSPGCRAVGKGFEEYIPDLGWVYSDCTGGKIFKQELCRCVNPPFVCPYTAYDNGFMENIPGVGSVYSDCPDQHKFNSRACKCTLGGENTDWHTDTDNADKPCIYKASGSGYIEKIPNVGDVYSDCPAGFHFNSHKCRCVQGTDDTGADPQIPTTLAPNPVTNKDCHFKASGDGYTEHIAGVGDVHYDCAAGYTFNVVVCSCIKKGTIVTMSPVVPDRNIDTVCQFTSSRDGYTEHIPGVGDVHYDCPGGQTFNALVCRCIKKGTFVTVTAAPSPPPGSQKPTSQVTMSPPVTVTDKPTLHVTNPDCNLIPNGNGYIESIPGVGDIYNDCPSSQVFDVSLCKCENPNKSVNHSEAKKDDSAGSPVSDCSRQETENGGFLEFVPGFGMVDGDCGPRKRFDGALCTCVDIKN